VEPINIRKRFLFKIVWKQEVALSSLCLKYVLETDGLDLNETHQILVYAAADDDDDDDHLIYYKWNILNKDTEALYDSSREFDVEVNAENTNSIHSYFK
jgi:hypothetical protein